jgi:hypothetical protein
MRHLLGLIACVALAAGAAGSSGASTLRLKNSTLGVSTPGLPPFDSGQIPGSVPILVSSGGGSFVVPPDVFAAVAALPTQLFTGVQLISSLNVTGTNDTGSFTAAGGSHGGFGGLESLAGRLVVGILHAALNVEIPLSVAGAGGQAQGEGFAFEVTVTGHGWTTGTAMVTGVAMKTPNGGFENTVTLSGYDNRATDHAGALQLVSPIRVVSNAPDLLPGLFLVQTLNFIPEPGTLLLLGAAIAWLMVLGRGKVRR